MTTTKLLYNLRIEVTVESEGRPDREMLVEEIGTQLQEQIDQIEVDGEVDNNNPDRDPVSYTIETISVESWTEITRKVWNAISKLETDS